MRAQLLDADAVLAGHRAADLDAELEDAVAELDRLLRLAGLVRVEEDQRMQVAVAGVEHVGARAARTPSTSAAIARSTRGSALRGIVPSMQ